MRQHNFFLIMFAVTGFFSIDPALSQGTVGNGTIIAPAAGSIDTSGVPQIGGETSAFATRHYSRGDNSGIGGSFVGTTSPTSESSPAVVVPQYVQATVTQFRLPRLDTGLSQSSVNSPALGSANLGQETFSALGPNFQPSSVALPGLPGTSSALTSPMSLPAFGGHYSSPAIENLPSFSRKPSTLQF